MKSNKKIIITCSAIAIIIILIATITLALFTARQEETAKINIGNLDVILVEDWPDDVPETGLERNTKTVKGESVAEKKAYVRMRFIPVVEYYYEAEEDGVQVAEWRTAPISQGNIYLTIEGEDWVKQGEYYYYKKILNSKEVTTDLNLSWQIVEIPSALAKYENIRTDVRVLLEYSQTSNEVWKDIFQIEDLPEGVER